MKILRRSGPVGLLLFLGCLVTAPLKAHDSAQAVYAALSGYPLERDYYNRLMVGVHVNGVGPFPFIIDTGASRSIVYRSLTAMMQLEAVPNKSRNVVTVNGYRRALIYPIGDIYALGRTLKLEETVALPDIIHSNAKGLIGVDLLAGRTLFVRPEAGLAVLQDNNENLEEEDWSFVQGRSVAYGSLALEIDMGGVMIPFMVDTGASDTVINTAGAEILLRSATGIRTEKISAVAGRGRTVVRERLILPEFVLGDRAFEKTNIYVADVPVFRLLGAARVPAVILGMNVLNQQDFALDFQNWRLYLRSHAGAEKPGKQ